MARRGENIRKRKDGRWEGRFIRAYDKAGKAQYRSVYAGSYSACKQKLQEAKTTAKRGAEQRQGYKPTTKLADILRDWLESIRVSAKHSTYVKYRNATANHILPTLGGIPLKSVSNNLVNGFLLKKRANGRLDGHGGLSDSTIHALYVILTSVLAFASEDGAASGITLKLKQPHKADPEIFILNQQEQTRLEAVLLAYLPVSESGGSSRVTSLRIFMLLLRSA